MSEFFKPFIPSNALTIEEKEHWSRYRAYNNENTFWVFFSQIIDADGGCQEVIRKIQAVATLKSITLSSSTASYCKARKKLATDDLHEIFKFTENNLNQASGSSLAFCPSGTNWKSAFAILQ